MEKMEKMKNMKKICTLILCFIMIFSMTGVFASDTSENVAEYKNETDRINFFYSLGVFDFEYFVDDPVTRKEFAIMLTKLLKHEPFLDSYKGDCYEDVEEDSYGSLHINFMKRMGIMTGKTSTQFFPEDYITLPEAAGSLIRMFGYQDKANAKGGWSAGILMTASDLGITRGVKTELSTEYLSAGAMAVMLFNAMNVEFVGNYSVEGTNTIVSAGESITLLDDYWKIVKAEGLLNASGNINLLGKSDFSLEETQIEINKKIYSVSEETYHDNLGMNVEYYYYKDDTVRIPEIIFMAVKNNGHKTRIYSNESPILNAGAIQLDKDGQTTKYKISGKAITLYNGTSILGLENQYIPKNGYIDLISNDGSNSYNVVIVYDFKNFRVKSIFEDKIVFDYNQKFNSQSSIEVEANGLKPQIIKDGNNVDVSDIKIGDIISVCYDAKTGYLIHVSSEKLKGWIDSIEGSPYSVYISNKKYYVSDEFKKLVDNKTEGTSAIEPGQMYNFSLDFMGNIYGMDALKSEMVYGYLMGVRKDDGLSDNVEVRIYSNFSGDFTVYPIAKKCYLDGENSNRSTMYTKLDTFLKNSSYTNPPVIKFRVNADKEVDKVTIKTIAENDYTKISDDVIVRSRTANPFGENNEQKNPTSWDNSYGFFSNHLHKDEGSIFIDTTIPFMQVPTSGKEEEFIVGDYKKILPKSDGKLLPLTFYDLDEFNVPGFAICFSSSQGTNVKITATIYGFESVSEALDKDGERVALLNLYSKDTIKKVYTTTDASLIAECKALQKGDFIQYNVDGSGNVCAIAKVFSYHSQTPVNTADYESGGAVVARGETANASAWIGIFNFKSAKKGAKWDLIRLKSSQIKTAVFQLGSNTDVLTDFTFYDGEKYYKGDINAIEEDDIVIATGVGGWLSKMVVIKNLSKTYDLYYQKQ